MPYHLNPALTYVRVSDDEVVVKGSPLEGFSVVVSDEDRGHYVADLVEALAEPTNPEDLHRAVGADRVALDAVERLLDDLVGAGTVLRTDGPADGVADWIAFVRYGHVHPPAQRHEIVCVGGQGADDVVEVLAELGLAARAVPDLDALAAAGRPLESFVLPDSSALLAARDPERNDETTDLADVPPDDRPRLVLLGEGAEVQAAFAANERLVAAGVPVLHAQSGGADHSIGPHVVPGATPCFWEYEKQRSRSLHGPAEYAMLVGSDARGTATTPAVTRAAFSAALVPFLVELALLGTSSLAGQVLRGRSTTAATSRHSVLRLPRCPVCLAHRPLLRNLLF